MSTERQCYSIANQELAIADYAKRNNLIIVQHYVDRAKSGLSVRGRTGLKTLLRDVVTGHAGYKVILVYDISRWGRFQDTDEAGHYEFLCREAGVQVRYCAEPFETDEAVAASLFKAVKRTMAAEFSRTLSTNVYAAKTYVAGKGYWVGGSPPYGWQRIAIVGDQRYFLGKGQRIAGSRGRVVLAHGDEEEIRDVRTIFRLAGRGLRDSEVATQLSYAGRTFRGSLWSRRKVGSILVHPVYMGCNVWGRTNQELKGPTTQVPSEKWTIMRGAFRPIISERLFEKVQKLRERRKALRRVPSNEEILQKARQFLGAKGWFTTASLASANMPSSEFYKYHFGSFRKVQSLIGYQSRRLEVMQRTRWLRLKFIRFLLARFSKRLVLVSKYRRIPAVLLLDGKVTIVVFFCSNSRWRQEKSRWAFKGDGLKRGGSVALVCRQKPFAKGFFDFWLVRNSDLPGKNRALPRDDPFSGKGRTLRTLTQFCEKAIRLCPE